MSIFEGIMLLAFVVVVVTALFSFPVVREYEAGVIYRNGRLHKHVEAGRYFLFRPVFRMETVDMREAVETVPAQELLTSDNIGVKISTVVSYRLRDPVRAKHYAASYQDSLYASIQTVLRDLIAGTKAEELVPQRAALAKQLTERVAHEAENLGLVVRTAEVKDVMFPGELKNLFAEVVRAQKESQAMLERARGETATMRHLANAARMVGDNPALLNLRMLQTMNQMSGSPGNTFIFNGPLLGANSNPDPSRPSAALDSGASDADA